MVVSIVDKVNFDQFRVSEEKSWPSWYRRPRLLEEFLTHAEEISSNVDLRERVIRFLHAANYGIYTDLVCKIEQVIRGCGLAPQIYQEAIERGVVFNNNGNPSAVYMLAMATDFCPEKYQLYRACAIGDCHFLKKQLPGEPEAVSFSDFENCNFTLMHCAALFGQVSVIDILKRKGVSLDVETSRGITPLMLAAMIGQQKVVRALLRNGADFERRCTPNEDTALMLAVKEGQLECVNNLLLARPNLESLDLSGLTPLMRAVERDNCDIAESLIIAGAKINAKNSERKTPLVIAISSSIDMVKLLLNSGASINIKGSHDFTPLHFAVLCNRADITQLFIDEGAELEAVDTTGMTPLILAVVHNHEVLVELLLNSEAQVNAQMLGGFTPLMIAAEKGYKGIVELLLEKGADQEIKNHEGWTASMIAEALNQKEIVDLLGATSNQKFCS